MQPVTTCFEALNRGIDRGDNCASVVSHSLRTCLSQQSQIGGTPELCAGQASSACLVSSYAGTTVHSAHCMDVETGIWETLLFQDYAYIYAKISSVAKLQMRTGHLSWKAYMSDKCGLRQKVLNAPDAWIEVADCRLEMMSGRVQELRRLRRYMSR